MGAIEKTVSVSRGEDMKLGTKAFWEGKALLIFESWKAAMAEVKEGVSPSFRVRFSDSNRGDSTRCS